MLEGSSPTRAPSARPRPSTLPRAVVVAFTVIALSTIVVLGVRAILDSIRENSPGVRVAERLVRTGRLEPLQLDWKSDWLTESLEPAPWAASSGAAVPGSATPLKGLTVVNLWASWCAPCRSELPSLVALARSVPNASFLLIGYDEDWDGPKTLLNELFHSFPREVIWSRDPLGHAGGDQDPNSFWMRLGATGIPETFFVRDGRVVGKVVGAIDWNHPDVLAYLQYLAGT